MAPLQTTIIGARNEDENAIIRKVDILRDGLLWYVQWFPRMFDLSGEPLFEDSHWQVPEIWQVLSKDNRTRVQILQAAEQIQGWVAFQIKGYTGVDGRECAYIAFISSAPWNRKRKGGNREYKGVGTTLIAVTLIYELKHIGNLTLELHSLPQTEIFYRKVGMKDTGRTNDKGLKLFRLEKPEALTLLRPFRSSLMRKGVIK